MSERIQHMELVYDLASKFMWQKPPVPEGWLAAIKTVDAMIKEAKAADADPWGKVKLGLEAVADTKLPIEPMLAISTAHVSEETAKRLTNDEIDGIIAYAHDDYGWQISITDDDEQVAERAERVAAGAFPQELHVAMEYARSLGCCWLLFDNGAEAIEGLKTYEW